MNDPSNCALGTVPLPVLQIHASRICNLACAHCYSASGPDARGALDPAHVCRVVSDAAALSYRVVAFSGGEPLVYDGVAEVLQHAKSLGMRTSLTTNGTLSAPRHLKIVTDLVDVVAVSVDGPSALHNRIRGSATAFERTCQGLRRIRETGVSLGLIHTLTGESVEHLEWLAEFAMQNGAGLLQIHPLELFGRGEVEMRRDAACGDLLARAYLACFALRRLFADRLNLQLDLAHKAQLQAAPERIYASEVSLTGDEAAASLLSVMVLEPNGDIAPLAYGFGRRYRICNTKEQDLAGGWAAYMHAGYREFRHLCRAAWTALHAAETPLLLNWHDLIVARSLI